MGEGFYGRLTNRVILIKEYRTLINEKHALDQMRLPRVDLDGKRHKKPDNVEKKTRATYEDHVCSWAPQADDVTVRILGFLAAAQMISRRYFAGVDIVYPATRENLKVNLETIANLREGLRRHHPWCSPERRGVPRLRARWSLIRLIGAVLAEQNDE